MKGRAVEKLNVIVGPGPDLVAHLQVDRRAEETQLDRVVDRIGDHDHHHDHRGHDVKVIIPMPHHPRDDMGLTGRHGGRAGRRDD